MEATEFDCSNYKHLKKYKKLYYVGNISLLNSLTLTVVGSRKMSSYGQQVVDSLCKSCALNSITTVSGLVDGVDIEVFKRSVEHGGSTIVCLGYGFDFLPIEKIKRYLPRRYKLTKLSLALASSSDKHSFSGWQAGQDKKISGTMKDYSSSNFPNILVLSQFENNQAPSKWTFPKRDDLLASVGRGVVVVEAADRSGTFYTVKQAFKEKKGVFAVPGNIYSPLSRGCHRLIVEGIKGAKANLYYNFSQISEYLNINEGNFTIFPAEGSFNSQTDSHTEGIILDQLSANKMHFDDLVKVAKLNSSELNVILTKLEILGRVKKVGGSYYVRIQ